MRVATYTQPTAPTRGSLVALSILIATILLGTGVVPTIVAFIGGPLEKVVTPFWLLLYVGAFLGLMFTHGINWISWLVRYRILLVVLMLGTTMSVIWSIDVKVSSERTIHLLGSTLLAIYIGFSVPLLTTLRVFAVVLAFFMVGSVLTAVAMPELGIQSYEGTQVWRGVFNSKNDLGFWAAVGVLLYITLSDSTNGTYLKIGCFLFAGICLGVLGLSQSATSLLAMLVAGALSLYLFIAIRAQLGFIRMAFMAVLFIGVTALAIANIDTAELVGRTDDLTGRGEVWKQTWKLILDRPLTGFGYGSLWFPTDATIWIQQSLTDFTWVVFHAHNGLLQVASEVGMPLAMIALLMVAQQLIEIFYCQYERRQVGVLFVLAFVTVYLISNFSEARFLVTRELFWIFFLALPVSMLRQINLVSTDEETESESPQSEAHAIAYGLVPGKPWLGPLREDAAVANPVRTAGAVAIGLPYKPEQSAGQENAHDAHVTRSHDDSMVGEGTRYWSEHVVDIDMSDGTYSLDETDINLGELIEPSSISNDTHDDTLDLTESGDSASFAEDMSDAREPLEHKAISYNDTLDIDRYDMDLDVADKWLDIPLEEDGKI